MYSKLEIITIFQSIKTITDYDSVMNAFVWLISEGFLEKSQFVKSASQFTFRRINNLGNYGN